MPNYRAMARAAARRQGLDPDIFEAQIQQESGFNPRISSPAGAQGIAQIMPATARGWGVNPLDPRAALNAAAAAMAKYVHQFGGSYEKALRAYNAGPGAVEASRGYAETNNYVKTILGGRRPPATQGRAAGGGAGTGTVASGRSSRTVTTRTPGVDNRKARASLLSSFLGNDDDDIVDFALQMRKLRDVPGTSSSRTTRTGAGTPGTSGVGTTGAAGGGVHGSQIKELFWQGPGGVNIKDGRPVPQGFVSGHTDHVHVAAGPRTTVRLGKIAQNRFGLHVGENPRFGGVTPVHVQGSYHYKNEAIDASGDPARERAFAHFVARYQRRRRR